MIAGEYFTASSRRGFRWTPDLGMLPIEPPAGHFYTIAMDLSADGRALVGVGEAVAGGRATLWTADLGMLDLNDHLPTLGINLAGWTLTEARGISDDGLSITGMGEHNGRTEGWIARLPVPAPCEANCDGSSEPPILNANDFLCFSNLFAAGDPAANCDRSTLEPVLNVNDFVCFATLFAAGCP